MTLATIDSGVRGNSEAARDLIQRIEDRQARIGVIGLGYVGLPLAIAMSDRDFEVTGIDLDAEKIELLGAGRTYLSSVAADNVERAVSKGKFTATTAHGAVHDCDVIVICVPTPLGKYREPDLGFVEGSIQAILPHLRAGQALVLVSTTYPGTTDEIAVPALRERGFDIGRDFFLIYAPEREDPGNIDYTTTTTPKVVGGHDPDSLAVGCALFGQVIDKVVPVSSMAVAEAVKLTENIFRSVNIALVNELKVIYDKMGIDVWEVIDAAKTKPFGFMPFYPGPGLGGHCIPIDPFYLTWKAREYGVSTRFIELSGEINNAMPEYVLARLAEALDDRLGIGTKAARILVVGVAYKKNVNDTRESPALEILERLIRHGCDVSYHDPYVPVLPVTRNHPAIGGLKSLSTEDLAQTRFDAVLICTDHDSIDYQALVDVAQVVVDTRNATRTVTDGRDKITKA